MAAEFTGVKLRYTGELLPPAESVDVRTWTRAHAVARHKHEGRMLGIALVLTVSGKLLNVIEVPEGAPGLVTLVLDYGLVGLVSALVMAAVWRTALGWGTTWVMVDPLKRSFSWASRLRRGECHAAAFEDLTGVESVESWYSDAVRLDFGERGLLVRVPRGQGQRFAESLIAAARQPSRS